MNVFIVGARSLVSTELQRVLKKRAFPCETLQVFSARDTDIDFTQADLAFFTTENAVSKALIPKAVAAGALCIDSSSVYRLDGDVPLVIPEINGAELDSHHGIIASPNCTTSIMLLPLAPLHTHFGIKQIICSTYQAMSGAGAATLQKFKDESRIALETNTPSAYGLNLFLHENAKEEEEKMLHETRKILKCPDIQMSVTCVRVPILRVHSLSVHVRFEEKIDWEKAKELLRSAPGVTFMEERAPTALDATEKDNIFCGRLRQSADALELWIAGDQLLKGAALNSVQIAENCASRMLKR